jgi:acyl-CoA synthetase (AMP-forming)/AMP-acid ligase II
LIKQFPEETPGVHLFPWQHGRQMIQSVQQISSASGVALQHVKRGEIVGYCRGLMKRYHNQPQATEEAIWRDERGRTFLRTGDMGRLDEEGYLYLLDRKKDLIISGGLNVFPVDIEAALAQHPTVAEACVIGIPNEKWGESPLALIVRRNNAVENEEEIREWADARLAKHQRIFAVEFRDELPRNAIGKILKQALRAVLEVSGQQLSLTGGYYAK